MLAKLLMADDLALLSAILAAWISYMSLIVALVTNASTPLARGAVAAPTAWAAVSSATVVAVPLPRPVSRPSAVLLELQAASASAAVVTKRMERMTFLLLGVEKRAP